jgi:dihydrofolate reductase
VKENEIEFIKNLKTEIGKDIWLCGGGALAGALLENKLLDELLIKLNPIMFGSGIPLFGGSKKEADLALLSSKTYKTGVLLLHYKINYQLS